jgi:hypothetical protein
MFVFAVLLAVQLATAQTQVDPKRNHRTRWWLSAIAALGAASVYTGATRTLPEMQPPGGLERSAGIVVTKQLGVNFGIAGAVLCGEWFLLRYQGAKHRKLEPAFMILNYAGATALSLDAAVELSGRKPPQ